MKILIINSAEPEIRDFVVPIEQILIQKNVAYDLLEYKQLKQLKISSFDGVIISGSPQGDDIIESHQPYFQWIRNYEKPILGICAGHHIIGHMYGAKIYSGKEIESGEIEIQCKKEAPIFKGLGERFKGIAMHNDSISVPDGFELIASTKTCVNEAMKKIDRDWYTLQFHPEINNPSILVHFIKLVKNYV